MDQRYQHPQVAMLWSKEWTYDAWWRIEKAVLRAQANLRLLDRDAVSVMFEGGPQPDFTRGDLAATIAEREKKVKHDVVAFLETMREYWGEPQGRWIHFGLTSSDVLDTAQGMRFKALVPTLSGATEVLRGSLGRWLANETPTLGRTHGQPAEAMSIRARAEHWRHLLDAALYNLAGDTASMQNAMISGPVGTFAHVPPEVENAVAIELGLSPVWVGSSQIAPRGTLGAWANSAAELVQVCAKIATDIRLMNLLELVREPQEPGQVGSSSMPHKNNPIRAEQICGLARLAAGYASMLQPLDLWLERDISHSCVERVAVPDLWHVLLHAMDQTTLMLRLTVVDTESVAAELEQYEVQAMSHHNTMVGILHEDQTFDDARAQSMDPDWNLPDWGLFMAQYPDVTS